MVFEGRMKEEIHLIIFSETVFEIANIVVFLLHF